MEQGQQIMKKEMKVVIPSEAEMFDVTRQAKGSCLCSPTTHAGSFRCRFHRSLQRTKSMDAAASSSRDSTARDRQQHAAAATSSGN